MRKLLLAALAASCLAAPAHAVTFVGALTIDNANVGADDSVRFGGFGSDLVRNPTDGLFYGMTDRGPGGGLLKYEPRLQVFSLDVAANGNASNFVLQDTRKFTLEDGVTTFNGQNPGLLTGDKSNLGRSFDPEGLAILPNGNFLVSDEYGPSVYEFSASGALVRRFETPANLIPRQADGAANYVDGRPTIVDGRQDNRGFEGLTISNDGTKAYAILQDPLVDEGPVNSGEAQGRRSRNLRIVEFDIATGQSTKQVIYQLEDRAEINNRTPGGGDNDFSANQQGRSIGVSSITQLPDGRFAIIERDNRGWGVDDSVNTLPVGSKRVYVIDIAGATDVSNVPLQGLATLPNGVVPVSKSLLLDVQAFLTAAGIPIVEKMEGLTFSAMLPDGGRALYIISDNDFSVTQLEGSAVQYEYCSSGPGTPGQLQSLGTACTGGKSLIPTYLYSFNLSRDEAGALGFFNAVPEPATWAQMIAGFGIIGGAMRRRPRCQAAHA